MSLLYTLWVVTSHRLVVAAHGPCWGGRWADRRLGRRTPEGYRPRWEPWFRVRVVLFPPFLLSCVQDASGRGIAPASERVLGGCGSQRPKWSIRIQDTGDGRRREHHLSPESRCRRPRWGGRYHVSPESRRRSPRWHGSCTTQEEPPSRRLRHNLSSPLSSVRRVTKHKNFYVNFREVMHTEDSNRK